MRKKGFTLLEVLIVVVIVVSVATFGVPAYKKAQERNKYLAAQGVLIDLGNGLRMLQAQLEEDYPTSSPLVESEWQTKSLVDDAEIDRDNANVALFARKYMAPIPFDKGNTYKGYSFYLCPENTTSNDNCCAANVVACMKGPEGQYEQARYGINGNISRVPLAD